MIKDGTPIKFKPEWSDDGKGDLGLYVALGDSYAHDTDQPRVRIVMTDTSLPFPGQTIVPLYMIEGF